MTVDAPRVLVAGIGNVFLGDDGFGVEVVSRLRSRSLPGGVEVADYGIRGFDLAFSLLDGYDAVVIVDAVPRGGPPGTVRVLQPEPEPPEEVAQERVVDSHGMNPMEVFRLVRQYGGTAPPTYLVGCEPATTGPEEGCMELSPPVAAAVDEAVVLVESLVERLAPSHRTAEGA
ncbi:MAG: hydrogenase maturation protease [Candidatus Dormibacteraeota bacterium]|nr:hydrogenase maturation protease [Candidatus Dormibacteraeota bacterium]MBO0706031.1 hydrogenase maturation protease [Candidatus Dormibacteraeota bacterium]MBO0759832.1 hydrogenase maturation protease [Candidatus Dormibacteraeota bacterium]